VGESDGSLVQDVPTPGGVRVHQQELVPLFYLPPLSGRDVAALRFRR